MFLRVRTGAHGESVEGVAVTYGLTIEVVTQKPFVTITAAEFGAIKSAKAFAGDCLSLEEHFSRVIDNYYEYELGLLDGALHQLLYHISSWSEFTGSIHEVNRRLMNLLSAGRAYRDQAAHFVSTRYGATSERMEQFKKWNSRAYDSLLGYRVMDALRNYTQHRGFGVQAVEYSGWIDGTPPDAVWRNALVPQILPARLAEDGGFKASVLVELQQIGATVDARPLVRQYVVGIAHVQTHLRRSLETDVTNADAVLTAAIDNYRASGQRDTAGLVAVERDQAGVWTDKVQVFPDIMERRKALRARGRRVPHLERQYVTNEPRRGA